MLSRTGMDAAPGPAMLAETYVAGLQGRGPDLPFCPAAIEGRAKAAMSPQGWDYVAGGAGLEDTVCENRMAFARWRLAPRMLAGVGERDLSIELFGRRLPAPLLLAPIGVQELAHKDADLATAKAAASVGVPMIFSNQASVPMETCAAAMGDAPRWFQLYWTKSDELAASLVSRAEACGCEAIVITLDTPLLGWRIRDMDNGYLPFLHGKGIAQYTSDPVFRALLPEPPEANPLAAALLFTQIYSDPSLTFERLAFLRARTKLPILLKGILHPDDARRALDHGMDGIIVSNHGGRQVDGSIAALDALPGVVAAVAGRAPVLFDSGVRTGADMIKALALGARAVCLGRPYVYALAAGGEAGVATLLKRFIADFDITLGLCGLRSASSIDHTASHRL